MYIKLYNSADVYPIRTKWMIYGRCSWWRHQMKTFFALLVLCEGNSPVTVEFPSQRPVTRGLDVSFVSASTNGWANNRYTDNLRRHCYHVTVFLTNWGKSKLSQLYRRYFEIELITWMLLKSEICHDVGTLWGLLRHVYVAQLWVVSV